MASSLTSIAASGLQAAQTQLHTSAHNIANTQTAGFRRQSVAQQARPDGAGVDATVTQVTQPAQSGEALAADVVGQLAAKNAFLANLAVFRTGDQTLGRLLDDRA